MRHGISPIVAVVLLIAIAVIAAVGLYFWTAGLATKQPVPNTPASITATPLGSGKVLIANLGQSPINASALQAVGATWVGCTGTGIVPAGQQILCNYSGSGNIVVYGADNVGTTFFDDGSTGGGGPTGGPVCGNNIVEGTESCDGTNLSSQTCITRGHTNGTLACFGNCTFNETTCCDATQTPETSCADGLDNDCDGLVDGADPDCAGPAVTWKHLFDTGSVSEYPMAIAETGSYVTISDKAGPDGCWVGGLDSNGGLSWSDTWPRRCFSSYSSVVRVTGGGSLAMGQFMNSTSGFYEMYLQRYDGSGNKLWSNTLATSHHMYCNSLVETGDGGFTAGCNYNGNIDIMKLGSNGALVGTFTYDAADDAYTLGGGLIKITDGYVFTGRIVQAGDSNVLVVKLNNAGGVVWETTLNLSPGVGSDYAYGVTELSDGGFAIAAKFSQAGDKAAALKLNSGGGTVWIWNSTTSSSYGKAIAEGYDGKILLGGLYNSQYAYTWLLDSNGNFLTSNSYTYPGKNFIGEIRPGALIPTSDRGFVFADQTGFDDGMDLISDVGVYKLNETGGQGS